MKGTAAILQRSLRRLIVSPVFLLISFFSAAQESPFDLWHEGKIVLDKGDTLVGMVKYDMQQDLVQFSIRDQAAEVFTARKVIFFEIFDNTVNQYRKFFTLPYARSGDYRTPIFFELLEEGKLTLLAREIVEYKTYSSPYYPASFSRLVVLHRFFFLKDNGDIQVFNGGKSDLLEMMGNRANEIEKYIRINNLRFDDKQDFTNIVAHYNSLFGS